MDKETEILSRLAANHLHLAQFEPLRATLLALKARNPDLALAILQTIVSNAGRFENVIWSRSCPSPSVLAFLSTIELLRFDDPTSPWGFGPGTLRLRADFLLLVQCLIDRVTDRLRKEVDLERIEKEKEVELASEGGELEEKRSEELLEKRDDLADMHGELGGCVRVLDKILESGVERLKFDSDTSCYRSSGRIEEEEIVCLRRIVLDCADVFDALCCNIEGQLKGSEFYGTGLVIPVRREEEADQKEDERNGREEVAGSGSSEEDDNKVFVLIKRNVQIAHLDAMKECLKEGDERGAVDHIRFLHLQYGVEKEDYRYV